MIVSIWSGRWMQYIIRIYSKSGTEMENKVHKNFNFYLNYRVFRSLTPFLKCVFHFWFHRRYTPWIAERSFLMQSYLKFSRHIYYCYDIPLYLEPGSVVLSKISPAVVLRWQVVGRTRKSKWNFLIWGRAVLIIPIFFASFWAGSWIDLKVLANNPTKKADGNFPNGNKK